jgi:hypothetical protein
VRIERPRGGGGGEVERVGDHLRPGFGELGEGLGRVSGSFQTVLGLSLGMKSPFIQRKLESRLKDFFRTGPAFRLGLSMTEGNPAG